MIGTHLIRQTALGVVGEMVSPELRQRIEKRLHEDVWPDEVRDDDEESWTPVSTQPSEKALDEISHTDAIKRSRGLYLNNPIAKGIIEKAVEFIIGSEDFEGARFDLPKATDTLRVQVEDFWEPWAEENDWALFSLELVRRALRDGECFIRRFQTKSRIAFRFIDPLDVKDPTGGESYGIKTKPKDVATPLTYFVTNGSSIKATPIPADEILHVKINADSDVKRGIPMLWWVLYPVRRYSKFVEARMILGQLRSALAVVRELQSGGPSAATTYADEQKTSTKTTTQNNVSVEVKREIWRPGTILTTTPGIKYSFLSPDTAAEDASKDGRMALLEVAGGVNMPAYMVTNDVSRANYASTTIEERLGVKAFAKWQGIFGVYFRKLVRMVLKWGVANGKLGGKKAATTKIEMMFPRIKTRNPVDESTADEKYVGMGAMSRQTAAERAGIDWSRERHRLEAEAAGAVNQPQPTLPPGGQEPDGETERLKREDSTLED